MDERHTVDIADVAMLVLVLIWGANHSVVKSALSEMGPLVFSALRYAGASVLLMFLVWIMERDLSVPRRDWGLLLLLSFLGNVMYQVLYVFGLSRTSASNASMMLSTSPIFVALIGTLTRSEKIYPRNWIGILLSFLGIFVLIARSGVSITIEAEWLAGNLMMLGSTVSWAAYTVLSKRLTEKDSVLKATAWMTVIATPQLGLVALPSFLSQDWQVVSRGSWLGLLFSAALAIAGGYVIWNISVQRLGSARTSAYSYLTPLVAVVVAWAFLGERMQPLQALGALAILVGVALARYRSKA
jgi:drug/metabolite transporter (DMT)-like permease